MMMDECRETVIEWQVVLWLAWCRTWRRLALRSREFVNDSRPRSTSCLLVMEFRPSYPYAIHSLFALAFCLNVGPYSGHSMNSPLGCDCFFQMSFKFAVKLISVSLYKWLSQTLLFHGNRPVVGSMRSGWIALSVFCHIVHILPHYASRKHTSKYFSPLSLNFTPTFGDSWGRTFPSRILSSL